MSIEMKAETHREPTFAGTYAVYEDGSGGYMLVTDDMHLGVQRKKIPAALIKMLDGNGFLGKMLKRHGLE